MSCTQNENLIFNFDFHTAGAATATVAAAAAAAIWFGVVNELLRNLFDKLINCHLFCQIIMNGHRSFHCAVRILWPDEAAHTNTHTYWGPYTMVAFSNPPKNSTFAPFCFQFNS